MGVLDAPGITPKTAAALGGRYPDTQVLFDDTFETGFRQWQELHQGDPTQVTTGPTFAPLSLSHPSVPGPALTLTTRSIADPGIMSQAIAMKRITHMEAPKIVDFEVWFAWGGESTTGFSPRYIHFMVDEMYGGSRHFWKVRWRNVNELDTSSRPKDWYLSSQGEENYAPTGYTSDLPWNGNKGSICRVKISIDLANRQYLALEANQDRYNLASVAGITSPGNNGVSSFDDPLFNNGLNFLVGILNRSAQPYMGWMAVTRARAIIRSS